MELPSDVLKGLIYINQEQYISDKIFKNVVQSVCNSLVENYLSSEKLPVIAGLNPLSLKVSYSTLSCLFLECAKLNSNKSELRDFLTDQKLKNDRIEVICEYYEKSKDKLRKSLARIGYSHPHVVDVDWRLDYQIKNSYQGKLSQPQFLIEFKTQNINEDNEKIQMFCTKEQLQDLVGKLQDACKSLERVTTQT